MKHLLLLLPFASAVAFAGAGDPDASFSGDGKLQIPFDLSTDGTHYDQARTLLLQDDGKIVVGGTAEKQVDGSGNRDFAIARVNPDGSLDSSFNGTGRVTIAFDLGGFTDRITGMAHYPGDRIVVAGLAADLDGTGGVGAWAVARLSSNGSLDTSFDLDGKTHFNIVPTTTTDGAALLDVAVQDDGKLLLAGYAITGGTTARPTVARLNADGSMDTSFDGDGIVQFDPAIGEPLLAFARNIAPLEDGKILVSGTTNTATGGDPLDLDMFATRLDASGAIDTSFGSGGTQVVSFNQGGDNGDSARDQAIDSQGRIILGGAVETATSVDMAVARLLSDGTPDADFGSSGRAAIGFDVGGNLDDDVFGVTVDASDGIYLAGAVDTANGADVGVLRVTTAGQPDPRFGAAGKVVVAIDNAAPPSDTDSGEAIEIDRQGRVVVAGFAELGSPSGNYDMLVLRLIGDQLFSDRFEALP